MNNLPAILSTLNSEISALTEKLKPVRDDHVADTMATLLNAGLSLPSAIKTDKAPAVYGFALQGVSTAGLAIAAAKLIRGEYNLNNLAFIPTPPELAAIARAETRTIVEDLSRLKARRQAMTPPEPEVRDEERIARMRALAKANRARLAASKAARTAPQEPMSPEKAEYYAKIMALRDASDVTMEQSAYRSVIAVQVSEVGSGE